MKLHRVVTLIAAVLSVVVAEGRMNGRSFTVEKKANAAEQLAYARRLEMEAGRLPSRSPAQMEAIGRTLTCLELAARGFNDREVADQAVLLEAKLLLGYGLYADLHPFVRDAERRGLLDGANGPLVYALLGEAFTYMEELERARAEMTRAEKHPFFERMPRRDRVYIELRIAEMHKRSGNARAAGEYLDRVVNDPSVALRMRAEMAEEALSIAERSGDDALVAQRLGRFQSLVEEVRRQTPPTDAAGLQTVQQLENNLRRRQQKRR